MADSEVLLEVDGGVAVVTLNAPDRRNALTPAMAAEFIAVLDEVDGRDDVGALVLTAVGKSFCAGGDVQTLLDAGQDPAAGPAWDGMGAIYDSFYRLGQVRVPTVAAVRGSAVGAGMNMLLAADLRVVADDARLICGFLKRGLHPGGGHFVILSRLIGREAAAAMALFGEEVSGARAAELGLAWAALPADESSRAPGSWPPAWPPTRGWPGSRWRTSARRPARRTCPGRSRPSSSGRRRCGRCAGPPNGAELRPPGGPS